MKREFSSIFLAIVLVIVFAALLLILTSNEVNYYNEAQKLVMDGLYTEVEGIATYAANNIPWDLHENVHPGDELSENFIYLNSIIRNIADHYPRASYIYTAKKDGDSYYFVLDSDEEDSFEPWGSIGYPMTVVPDALVLAFLGEVTHTDGFYHDAWGSFISGYAPIFSPSGEVVAVLAVDVNEEIVNEEIEKVRDALLIHLTIIAIIGLIASFIGISTTLYLLSSHKLTKSAQDMLLQAINAAREGSFEYDLDKDVLLCGPETAKLFGYNIMPGIEKYSLSRDFIIGQAVYEDKKNIDDVLSVQTKRMRGTKRRKFVFLWKFHVENMIKTMRFKGYVTQKNDRLKIIGMVENYTEQEKNKVALLNASKKMQILYSISSHDIRNIISAVYSYADLILEEEISDNVRADIEELIQSSEDSTFAISSFSNVSRELGTNLPEWIDLRTLVNDIFESDADLKGIRFINDIDNVDIYASPQTSFVIQTFFDFSRKHCDQVTSISMHTNISQDVLHIIYEDDGVGISEGEKKRIFDFDATKKDKNALYIAKEILSITDISIKEGGTDANGVHFVITVKPGWFRFRESE